ncbi:MAG TPA: cell division protein ZapE [Steroidobacteraceae bacterium]
MSGGVLHERYAQALGARGYQADAAQLAALGQLEALRAHLLEPRAGAWRRLGGAWRRLTGRTRPRGLAAQRLLAASAASAASAMPAAPAALAAGGVYLYGAVGRGKTMLLDLFHEALPPGLGQRTHFHHFMRDVHARLTHLRARRAPLEALARALARHTRVLCLDELFVSDIADAMILGALFEALLRADVALVITSNLAPSELYGGGLQRSRFLPTIELLVSRLAQCRLDGAVDYRLRQLQRLPIYLDSREAGSSAQLERLFGELAGGSGERNPALRLLGRTVRALRCRADVVWFDFATLCDGARSQNDYADLAQEFRTVMLSGVPLFGAPEQDDAARRFIALVDEFYDQGTKLVLSAAAAPPGLYPCGRLHAEFARTASRLVEMQAPAYLARSRRS